MQENTLPPNEKYPSDPIKNDFADAVSPPVSPDNPPWNGWTAFGVWAASVVFIIIFPNIFVLLYLSGQSLEFTDKALVLEFVKTDPTAVLIQIISIIPAHICTLLLAWAVVTRIRKLPFFDSLGWQWNGFKVWHSFAIFVVFYGVAIGLAKIFGEMETDFDRILKSSRTVVLLVAFIATFSAPLVEEIIYRGILYSAFQRAFGVVSAVLFVTVLFTAVHIPQYSTESVPNYASIITLFLLSLTLTLIRVRTKSLLPCVVLHFVVNGVQSLMLLFQPQIESFVKDQQAPAAVLLRLFN